MSFDCKLDTTKYKEFVEMPTVKKLKKLNDTIRLKKCTKCRFKTVFKRIY